MPRYFAPMQPVDRKARSRSSVAARVRMFLKADLGWLHGYPLEVGAEGVRWACTPEDRTEPEGHRTIDRDALSRATRSWSKATRRYHRALPDAVDHAEVWARRVPVVLDALKPSVHDGGPFPPSLLARGWASSVAERATTLARRFPELGALVDAMSWILFTTPHLLPEWLDHLEASTTRYQHILGAVEAGARRRLGVRLCWLAARHGSPVHAILEAMASESQEPAPTTGAARYSGSVRSALRKNARKARKKGLPTRSEATTLEHLERWTASLVRHKPEYRERALALFGATFPDLTDWRRWWRDIDAQADRIPGLLLARPPSKTHLEALVEQLGVLHGDAPPDLPLSRLLATVDTGASEHWLPWHRAALDALRAVPRGAPPIARPCLLACWTDTTVDAPRAMAAWLPLLGPWLTRMPDDPDVLRPWMELWGGGRLSGVYLWSFDHLVCEECGEPARMEALLALVEQLFLEDRDLYTQGALDNATTLVGKAPPTCGPETLIPILRQVELGERALPIYAYATAAALSGPDRPFDAVFLAIAGKDGDEMSRLRALEPLIACPEQMRAALGRLLVEGEGQRLVRVGPKLASVFAEGRPVPLPTREHPAASPEWVRSYPEPLHLPLARLAAAHSNPRPAAKRILGDDLPTREALERELATIEGLLDEDDPPTGLRKRRDTLRRRIANPGQPSPARLARLMSKVDRAARQASLDAWEARVSDAFAALMRERLGVADPGDWVERPRVAPCLAHAFKLSRPFRNLAITAFQRRCDPPPWDFRDHPDNSRFLDRVRALGIDPSPWLEPFERSVEAEGRTLRVHIEQDPAEVLFMGGHFHTCLSPGADNYFSVISNIVDINKAVLYARDASDRVVGRCLLALTGDGGLLAFHPYAHGEGFDFREVVREALAALADAMGTVVVKRGEVPTLVAPEWYDDGPEDLTNGFPTLATGTPFRDSLPTTPLEGFAARCAAALAPVGVNALTLPLLLALPEMEERPELVLPLLPAIERMDPADPHWVLALRHLERIGEDDRIARLLRRHAVPFLQSLGGETDAQVMEPLVRLQPSLALRALRQTRRRGFRSLEDEHPERRYWGARALESLHRPQQALAHFREIADGPGGWGGRYRNLSRKRIAALETRTT
jgi:nucleotide-binding universal stress UspA family protein